MGQCRPKIDRISSSISVLVRRFDHDSYTVRTIGRSRKSREMLTYMWKHETITTTLKAIAEEWAMNCSAVEFCIWCQQVRDVQTILDILPASDVRCSWSEEVIQPLWDPANRRRYAIRPMGYLMDWRSCRLSWGCRWLKSPRLLGIGSSSLTCRTVTWEAFRFVFKLSYVAYAIIQTELPASLFKIFDQLDMKALPLISYCIRPNSPDRSHRVWSRDLLQGCFAQAHPRHLAWSFSTVLSDIYEVLLMEMWVLAGTTCWICFKVVKSCEFGLS